MGTHMLTLPHLILLIQAGSTLAMVGLIWFVQIVHYPLMADVGQESFVRYETEHQRLTSYVVGPFMIAEVLTALALLVIRPSDVPVGSVWLGLALLAVIWIGTYTIQVPQHALLAQGFNESLQRKLVQGNWLRSLVWSGRGVLVLWMLAQVIRVR